MRYLLASALLLSLCALGQEAPKQAPPKKGPNPFENTKNLKIFTSQTPEQLRETMNSFRIALGVNCLYCHVQGDWASDANAKKETARQMVAMSREINGHFPSDGKMRVRCYTCHRGQAIPATAPPAAEPGKEPAKQ